MTALAEPPDAGLAPADIVTDSTGALWMYLGGRGGGGRSFPYTHMALGVPRDDVWRRRYRGWLIDALRIAAEGWSTYTERHFRPLVAAALPHLDTGTREAHVREAARLIEAARSVDTCLDDPATYAEPGTSRQTVVNMLNAQADDELARAVDRGHPLLTAPDVAA